MKWVGCSAGIDWRTRGETGKVRADGLDEAGRVRSNPIPAAAEHRLDIDCVHPVRFDRLVEVRGRILVRGPQ